MTRRNRLSPAALVCHVSTFVALTGGFVSGGRTAAQENAAQPHKASLAELRRPMVNAREVPLYTIHMGPEFESTWKFGSNGTPAIPAAFFGEGSDPWVGNISCVGIPLDPNGPAPTSDLVVQHEALEWIPNPETRYGPREIPKNFKLRCQMVKLREQGTEPLTVTYDNGKRSEKWDVVVTLAKDHPGGGQIEITWVNADGNGGIADIEIAVKVDFTFTQQGTGKVVTLTSGIEWLSETNHYFTRWADTSTLEKFHIPASAQGTFIPASESRDGRVVMRAGASCNRSLTHSFTLAPTKDTIRGVAHGTLPQIKQFAPRKD